MSYPNTTVYAEATLEKPLPDRYKIIVSAKLYQLGGNQRPHFSVTAEMHNMRRRGDNRIESCGCLHDDVLEHFPALAPVVALHLADDNGVPMYAVANGAYWLGYGRYKDATFADHSRGLRYGTHPLPYFPFFENLWRITSAEAREADLWCDKAVHDGEYPTRTDALEVLAVAMLPRWKAEADAGLALIRSLA